MKDQVVLSGHRLPFMDRQGGGAEGPIIRSQSRIHHWRRASRWREERQVLLQSPQEQVPKRRENPGDYDFLGIEGAINLVESKSKDPCSAVKNVQGHGIASLRRLDQSLDRQLRAGSYEGVRTRRGDVYKRQG